MKYPVILILSNRWRPSHLSLASKTFFCLLQDVLEVQKPHLLYFEHCWNLAQFKVKLSDRAAPSSIKNSSHIPLLYSLDLPHLIFLQIIVHLTGVQNTSSQHDIHKYESTFKIIMAEVQTVQSVNYVSNYPHWFILHLANVCHVVTPIWNHKT